MEGHVVGTVEGRFALGRGIDAEHTEIAGLARPHPVVRVAAELAQRLGHGEHQTDVVILAVDGHIIGIVAIEALRRAHHARIGLLIVALHSREDGVDMAGIHLGRRFRRTGAIEAVKRTHHTAGAFLHAHQEAHEKALHGPLFGMVARHESVLQDVVLRSGERLDGTVAAMMVGEDQAVGAHHHARAEAAKAHHGILERCAVGVVELLGRERQSQVLHHTGSPGIDIAEHPHALIGPGRKGSRCPQDCH